MQETAWLCFIHLSISHQFSTSFFKRTMYIIVDRDLTCVFVGNKYRYSTVAMTVFVRICMGGGGGSQETVLASVTSEFPDGLLGCCIGVCLASCDLL